MRISDWSSDVCSSDLAVTVDFGGLTDSAAEPSVAAAHFALGAALRAYQFDKYRTKMPERRKPTLSELFVIGAGDGAKARFDRLSPLVEAVGFTRDLDRKSTRLNSSH